MPAHDPSEPERLIHELEVHQAELESQNRQLREAQQLLEESRARFADLYDFAPIAYCTLDRAGIIVEINLAGAALIGRERAHLIGKPFATAAPITDKAAFRDHHRKCMAERCPCIVELTLSPPGRAPVTVEMKSSAEIGPDGEPVACRSALADVTARKQAENALRAAMHMRETFLAVVSHDLRNPLNTILMASELLLRKAPDEEHGRHELETIRSATERMNRLVSDLLDLSSMDAGHLSMQRSLHDFRDIVAAALETVRAQALSKGVKLETILPQTPLETHCDRGRIIQVLINLVGNAIKFTERSGAITVEARALGSGVLCAVRDTGVGIAEDLRGRIFEPYWQADKGKAKGTGLGLSIAKGIVELHGGRIWVDSTVGRGSTFDFTLPDLSVTRLAAPPERRVSQRHANRTLLIVDDEADARSSLSEILTGEGYHVVTVENGQEALEYLRHADEPPSLVLLDLVMPVMDGWCFLAERSRDSRLARTRVVIISAQSEAQKVASDFQLAGYLEKPIGMANLFRLLHELHC